MVNMQDGEAQLEATLGKVVGLEKAKNRSQMEAEALVAELDKVPVVLLECSAAGKVIVGPAL